MNREQWVGKEGRSQRARRAWPGIVIHEPEEKRAGEPRIHAFIWGGEMCPRPTLQYGRRKGAA